MQITKEWLLNHGVYVDKFDVYHNGRKIKATSNNNDGYIRYFFHHNSTLYHILAHVLLYTWYVQDIPDGYEIHHKDRDKSNNDIKNLEMLTPDEHRDRHDVHMGKNMGFKVEMPKKKVYTIDYLNYMVEKKKLIYEEARKNKADKKILHTAANNYWKWLNKRKQFTGDL